MFDSQAMVEHSEEQPAAEAAMMASIMVGRASSSGSSGGGGGPPKTVSPVLIAASREKNDRWCVPKIVFSASDWPCLKHAMHNRLNLPTFILSVFR